MPPDAGDTMEAEEAQPQTLQGRKPRRSDALLASAATIWDKGWGAIMPNLNSSLRESLKRAQPFLSFVATNQNKNLNIIA